MTEVKLDLDGLERGPFVLIQGQSFSSEQEWINRASRRLTSHPEYRNTEHARALGWQGHHFTALCFDQKGRRVRSGGDFQRATEDNAYPVWWIWPDQIEGCFRALLALAREAEGQGWRDIESAPKDGTIIQVWADGYQWPETVHWQAYDEDAAEEIGEPGFWTYAERLMASVCDSAGEEDWTHWRPLPTPPSRTQSGEDA